MSVVDSLTDRELERVADRHLLLGGIVVLGLALRAYALGAESLWVDEVFTTRVVLDYSPAYILFRLPIQDPHPPLYYELLWLWTRATGVSETSVRALSALFGAASIPLVYAVADRLYDRRVGLVAALFFAVSPFYVWYGREARMYALLTLLALASMYVMLAWLAGEDGRRGNRWTYAAVTVGLVYTHAFGALLVLAQNAYVLVGLDPDDADEEWYGQWIRMQGVVGVVSIPWFFNLLGGMFGAGRFEGNVSWIPGVSPVDLWKILGSYVGRTQPPAGPNTRRNLWSVGGVDLSVLGELATLLALAALVYLLVRRFRGGSPEGDAGDDEVVTSGGGPTVTTGSSDPNWTDSGAVLAYWLVVPLAVMYAVSVLLTPLLIDRFTAAFGVAGIILAARAFTLVADTDRQTLAAAGVVVLVLAVPLSSFYTQPQKEQWGEAATIIEENADAGAMVVVTPSWANDSYHYYAERDDLEYASVPAGAAGWVVTSATRGHSSVWLVVRGQNATQRDRVLGSMDRLGFQRDRRVSLTELDVYHFVRTGT
jgi:mannosyltransferase